MAQSKSTPGMAISAASRYHLLTVAVLLAAFGLVAVATASIDLADRQGLSPYFYLLRQGIYLGIGAVVGFLAFMIPTSIWQKRSYWILAGGFLLLALLQVPGIGTTVNGSTRWIRIGPINLQVAELAKLCILIYVADYLHRHSGAVRARFMGLMKPLLVITPLVGLILIQPDLGSAVVILAGVGAMLFLAGVPLRYIAILGGAVALLGYFEATKYEYRMNRLGIFMNPFEDMYGDGYQLVHSLIGFGRGEWFGLGLGNGLQKMGYLPEPHTDFIFSVIAEEMGLFGNLIVILLFVALFWFGFRIARHAERFGQRFNAYLAYGITFMISFQAMVNIGVASGLLPTKGLTLPLISYGGSSVVIVCILVALVMRVDWENDIIASSRQSQLRPKRERAGRRSQSDQARGLA